MAPSLRRSAPSSSTRNTTRSVSAQKTQQVQQHQSQTQLNLGLSRANFGRVTKARSGVQKVKSWDVEKEALQKWNEDADETQQKLALDHVEGQAKCESIEVEPVQSSLKSRSKRKRGEISDSESGDDNQQEHGDVHAREQIKKRRVHGREQLLSPPVSQNGTDCDEDVLVRATVPLSPTRVRRVNAALSVQVELPQSLRDQVSMHAAFLKALSLHYAHNGASTPAELNALMDSMTRLWKKQTVRKDALQKMLGLYEIASDSTTLGVKQVEHRRCPFKIVTSGLGTNVRTNLEYVAQAQYNEKTLQASYSDLMHSCFRNFPVLEDSTQLPLLTVTLGIQTSLHRAKAASTRAEILNLSASAQSRSTPDFSRLSITDVVDHTPAAVKSRTLSLFDRVRAKGLAATNNVAPSAEQISRRHAMGRIVEIVEFLRMKQQQKLSSRFHSSIHDSPSKARTAGKVSFSLSSIITGIRQSVGVPIGEEEVKVCLRILSQELPGDWCRMIELGSVVSITLQGSGMSGFEVKRYLETSKPVV